MHPLLKKLSKTKVNINRPVKKYNILDESNLNICFSKT